MEVVIDIETKDPNLKELGPGSFRGTVQLIGVAIYKNNQ